MNPFPLQDKDQTNPTKKPVMKVEMKQSGMWQFHCFYTRAVNRIDGGGDLRGV